MLDSLSKVWASYGILAHLVDLSGAFGFLLWHQSV